MAGKDPLDSILVTLRTGALAEHAREIGNLCICWSRLELECTMLLLTLMQPVGSFEAMIPLTNMDFREKLASITALGFHKKPSADWFTELREVVNDLDNNLRPLRNRYVHDHWLAGGDQGVIKFSMKTSVYYEQARTLALRLFEMKPVPAVDVFVLTVKVLAAAGRLMDLRAALPPLPDIPAAPSPMPDLAQDQSPDTPTSPPESSRA